MKQLDHVFKADNLSHSYDGTKMALDKVSFSIEKGGFTALLGPNGAGKSTLFSLASSLNAVQSGHMEVAGFDIHKYKRQALARMGIVFQQTTLDLDLTILQNLRYFAALHGLSGKKRDQRIDQELDRLELTDRRHEKVRLLNGGHKRRVEIARSLLHAPDILLLDEATVGLDVPSRKSIVDHVHRLCQDDGVGVLWATHLIDEVMDKDRVVVIHKGCVKADAMSQDLQSQYGSLDQAFHELTGQGA